MKNETKCYFCEGNAFSGLNKFLAKHGNVIPNNKHSFGFQSLKLYLEDGQEICCGECACVFYEGRGAHSLTGFKMSIKQNKIKNSINVWKQE